MIVVCRAGSSMRCVVAVAGRPSASITRSGNINLAADSFPGRALPVPAKDIDPKRAHLQLHLLFHDAQMFACSRKRMKCFQVVLAKIEIGMDGKGPASTTG